MSKYADKRTQRIELTHPHSPAVSWCRKCNPSYVPPTQDGADAFGVKLPEKAAFLSGLDGTLDSVVQGSPENAGPGLGR